jgi:hypothetical protein
MVAARALPHRPTNSIRKQKPLHRKRHESLVVSRYDPSLFYPSHSSRPLASSHGWWRALRQTNGEETRAKMNRPKFKIGQSVLHKSRSGPGGRERYIVTKVIPAEQSIFKYQLRNQTEEPQELIATESKLLG